MDKEELEKLLGKLDAEIITHKTPIYRDDHMFFLSLGLIDEEEVKPVDFEKDIGIQFNDFKKVSENIEDVERLFEHLKEIKKIVRECKNCKFCLVHRNNQCDGCLDPEEGNPRWAFRNHVYGDPDQYRLDQERSGAINIVLGHEGEHEVNTSWSFDEAYRKLADTSEMCGGVTFREGNSIFVDKTFGPAYRLVYVNGKLDHILQVRESEIRGIRKSRMWWTAEDIDIQKLAYELALKEAYNYAEILPYEHELNIGNEQFMVGQVQFLLEKLKNA